MERSMNSPGHRSRTAEDAVRILQLVRSLDQLHVQRASVMASLTDTLAGILNLSPCEMDRIAAISPPEAASAPQRKSNKSSPSIMPLLSTSCASQKDLVTSTKATEDSLALYCRINGKELHIGYLPLWVTQNPGRIPFYISPDNLPFARSTSSRDTERETRTPTPERLSRGIVLGEDVFPIEDTMIVEDQLTVTLEEQPARTASSRSNWTSSENGSFLALPTFALSAFQRCVLDVSAINTTKVVVSSLEAITSYESQAETLSEKPVIDDGQQQPIGQPFSAVDNSTSHHQAVDEELETQTKEQPVAEKTNHLEPEKPLSNTKETCHIPQAKQSCLSLGEQETASSTTWRSNTNLQKSCSPILRKSSSPTDTDPRLTERSDSSVVDSDDSRQNDSLIVVCGRRPSALHDGSESQESHSGLSQLIDLTIDRVDHQDAFLAGEDDDDDNRSTSFFPVHRLAVKSDLRELETPDKYSSYIEQGSIYDQSLVKAGSGEELNVHILALERDKPIIHAWILPQDADSAMPENVGFMIACLTSFYCHSCDCHKNFRPIPGEAVAVRYEEDNWTRGVVEERLTDGHMLVRLIDLGGHIVCHSKFGSVQPLHCQFAEEPAMIWRARIAGFLPSRYDEMQARILKELIVGKRMTATVVALEPMPVIRLFDVDNYALPVEIPTLVASQEQRRKGVHTAFAIVMHVPPTDELYHFLLVDTQEIMLLEFIDQMVQNETRTKLPVKSNDLVVAVPVAGHFYRAYVLDRSEPGKENTGQVSVELVDYGVAYKVNAEELYGLTDDTANRRTPSTMCCLEKLVDVSVEDWVLTRSRLKALEGSVVAYTVQKTLEKGRLSVQIWDNNGQLFSVADRTGQGWDAIPATAVNYPEFLRTGAVVEVVPTRFLREFACLETQLISDIKGDTDEEINELSFALETDIGEEFASPPALGMVVRALATNGKWYRGITATVDEVRPDVFLIFHLDVGKYEWTPVCNLRPLPVELLSPVARAIPLVVGSKSIDIEHTDSSIR